MTALGWLAMIVLVLMFIGCVAMMLRGNGREDIREHTNWFCPVCHDLEVTYDCDTGLAGPCPNCQRVRQ